MYDWKRRWLPRDLGDHANGDSSARARAFQAVWQLQNTREGVSLEELRHVPCLILLGEPGMGKSYALRREHAAIDDSPLAGLVRSHHVDLAGSQSTEDIRADLFDNEIYREWKSGTHWLFLFIDSVDQSRTPVEHVITAISNQLASADISRLQLRLVCRDYDWSLSLADALRHCWRNADGAPVCVYQLAPLNTDDIRLAAIANGKDSDAFIRQVEDANALPLATIPITLEMLLQTDQMTDSRVDLYRSGIRRLCGLSDENVRLTEKAHLDRFETASKLAAVMALCDKYSIDIDGNAALNESSLEILEVLLDRESEDEERLVRATLKSALFHGTAQRTWAHQSFAEYLAATFLSQDSVSVDELLQRTTTPDGRFAPQLHETLRWLMDMRPDFLQEVIKRQPMLALMSDLSHLSEREYRKFVKALLGLDDPYVYSNETWELRNYRASHPSAKNVLLPYLMDNEGHLHLRRFVFRLLECHGFPDIEDELVELAFNEYEDPVLRQWSARGIQVAGSADARSALKPYVFGRHDDPDDEIKGYALQALWPRHLTVEELFAALTPPKVENYWGSYRVFLIQNSIENDLQPSDLPTALMWVDVQPSRHDMPFSLQDLPGKIMRKAWDNRHMPGVLEAFAKTAITTDIVRFDGLFGRCPNTYPPDKELDEFEKAFVQETEYRRELAMMCLPYLVASDKSAQCLAYTWPPIVISEDMDWLLGLLESETDEMRRGQIAELVAWLGRSDIEKVYYASERHPEVNERTKRYFESRLDNPNVISEREHFYRRKEIDEQKAQQRAEVRPHDVIATALDRLESGETWQWHNVIYGLDLHPDQIVNSWEIRPDLTGYPNWSSCNEHTQIRIAKAAEAYLRVQKLEKNEDGKPDWYFANSIPRIEYSAYFAIFLLHKIDASALQWRMEDHLRKWSKIIVWFPYVNIILNDGRTEYHYQTRDLQKDLLRRLYQNTPRALLSNLRELLIAKDSNDSYIGQELDKIEHLWDPTLQTTLLDLLRDASLSANGQRSLLDILLKHDSAGTVRFAEEMIRAGYSNEVEKQRLVEFCAGLMLSELEFDWQAVWNEMQNNENVGKAIVEKIAEEDRSQLAFSAHVCASELADLFIWVEKQYPSCEDPQIDGAHWVSPREQVGRWRNNIIAQLRKRDGQEALLGIRRILDSCPQLDWIQDVRVELEETVEKLDWEPALPSEVLNLTMETEKRRQMWKRKSLQFLKQNWKWLVGFAAKYFPFLFGLS